MSAHPNLIKLILMCFLFIFSFLKATSDSELCSFLYAKAVLTIDLKVQRPTKINSVIYGLSGGKQPQINFHISFIFSRVFILS